MIASVYESGQMFRLEEPLIKECAIDARLACTVLTIVWFAEGNSHRALPIFPASEAIGSEHGYLYGKPVMFFWG